MIFNKHQRLEETIILKHRKMINNIHKTSKVKQNLVNIKGQMVNINNIAELELKLFLAGTFQNFW